MQNGFVMSGWRAIIATIDKAVLNLIVSMYSLLKAIAEQQIFSNETIDAFATRVYTFLALIMIFKVTFSLITYLVNPESINDKTNGAGNMAKNVVITLVLIIMVPYGFDFLYRAQAAILKDNLVGKVILGSADDLTTTSLVMDPACGELGADTTIHSNPENMGQYLALVTMRPFYQIYKEPGKDVNVNEMNVDELKRYCGAATVDELMSSEIYNGHSGGNWIFKGKYYINYSTILSTVACFVVMILMLTTCLDIAVRTIKLGFLEIIAPIPIISYVDPKSGKDGILKKWLNNVIGTWTQLFIKLAALYFSIYVISLVGEAIERTKDQGIWMMLFLTIGALMFAKQAPKLIEDIFGIKMDTMGLHPIKKIQEEAVGGKMLTGLPGKALAVGGAIGMSGLGTFAKLSQLGTLKDNYRNKMMERDLLNKKGNDLFNQLRNKQISLSEYSKRYSDLAAEKKIADQAIADSYNKYRLEKEKFSNKNALTKAGTGISAAARAAIGAASADSKNIKSAIKAASDAATKSAKTRTYRDTYDIGERMADSATNWGDVKYKGGTASKIEDSLKQLNDKQRILKYNLELLERSLANAPSGSYTIDGKTNKVIANTTDKNIIDLVKSINEHRQNVADNEADIKKYTKILEQKKESSK